MAPSFLFPLCKSVLLPFNGDLHLACHGCRPQTATLLIFNKPIFAGELSGSVFLSGQDSKHASMLSHFSSVWLFAAPWTVAHRLLCPRDSPGKITGVGCHALLQGIFQTQRLNPRPLRLLYWQAGSYPPVSPHCHFLRRIFPSYSTSPPKVVFTPNTPSLWESYLVSHRRGILTGYLLRFIIFYAFPESGCLNHPKQLQNNFNLMDVVLNKNLSFFHKPCDLHVKKKDWSRLLIIVFFW